jgi:hypothetical protein
MIGGDNKVNSLYRIKIEFQFQEDFSLVSFKIEKCIGFGKFKVEKCIPKSLGNGHGRSSAMTMQIRR